jgi:hypothetical protein
VVIENPVGLLASLARWDGVDRTGWDMAAVVRGLEDLGYGWAYRVVDGRYLGSTQRGSESSWSDIVEATPDPHGKFWVTTDQAKDLAPARTFRRAQGGPRLVEA